jgi:hypothetical protein
MALRFTALLAGIAHAGEPVHVENATQPSRCAENDNVYVKFLASGITHFSIEARHPAYISSMREDRTAADFSGCDQSHDPGYSFDPLDLTLFEDAEYKLVGHRFARFWRPENVDVRVGDTTVHGLHLIQLLRKLGDRNVEILVVYPSDGYWRMKPLPPRGIADTAYGGSFLVGPIREEGRPYVALRSIAFDRASLSFRVGFGGGEGRVQVVDATAGRTRVDITLPPAAESSAFAALRSMYVSDDNADTAEAFLVPAAGATKKSPILDMPQADSVAVTFARVVPSRHNTSAPDLVFEDFRR